MNEFLLVCATIVLVAVAGGLARALRGPGDTERIMAAPNSSSAIDLALTLALLAAFAAIAFVKKGSTLEAPAPADDAAAGGPPGGRGSA
jgi:multicomponent Na+:H+ antiporter subunit F